MNDLEVRTGQRHATAVARRMLVAEAEQGRQNAADCRIKEREGEVAMWTAYAERLTAFAEAMGEPRSHP